MTQQPTGTGGFTVHSTPTGGPASGAAPATFSTFSQQVPPLGEEDEENVRESTAARHLYFSLTEIGTGLLSNAGQMVTTFYSFIFIQLGAQSRLFVEKGPFGGLGTVMATHPAFVWVALVFAVGSQVLFQAGCQILTKGWKKRQRELREQEQPRYGIVRVLLQKEVGYFFTGVGFVLDAVGDLGFAYAFLIPWYVCILFAVLMYGLSTFILYDGDERFHYAYPIWWKMHKARKVWTQAALEKARIMQGLTPDGRALAAPR